MIGAIRCYITDRKQFDTLDALLDCIKRSDAEGVDIIQIREKDLPVRELCRLVERAVAACSYARVMVNSRVDVAWTCGARGVHLPSDAPSPTVWRDLFPRDFLFGVSCHVVDEVVRAESETADYVVFGPVFDPLSKAKEREAVGLDGLRAAARAVKIPVLALGGITKENASLCLSAGAAGVAGITLFQGKHNADRTF